jgi:hypothetical protein
VTSIAKLIATSALAASSVVGTSLLVAPESAQAQTCGNCDCFITPCSPTNSFCWPVAPFWSCSVDGGVCFAYPWGFCS